MSADSPIQWTDATWNPIRGCSLVSAGCTNCYAMGVAARFSGPGLAYEGLARRRSNGKAQWTGEVRVILKHMADPIRWRKPRRIFVNSMSDLFHENVSDETIMRVWEVMEKASHHTFQILTKRPQRMLDFLGGSSGAGLSAPPLPNVWLGVSTENQATADERIPLLLQTPAAVRFISAQPLLGPIELRDALGWRGARGVLSDDPDTAMWAGLRHSGLHWVIVGGESGRDARPCDLAWVRSIVDQCRAANVSVFVKQLGRRPVDPYPHELKLVDSHGGDISEWPEDLRVREFPTASPSQSVVDETQLVR